MFSVDNFYVFFQSHYGWEKTNSLIYKFQDDGSKNFIDLRPYHDATDYCCLGQPYFASGGSIILHDQEPFVPSLLNIYSQHYAQENNNQTWQHVGAHEALLLSTTSCSWPIICHSELDSQDIRWAQSVGVIPCYYFWHGLVSRDWYRHWRYHADLVNKKLSWRRRFLLYARDHSGSRQYRTQVVSDLRPIMESVEYNWQGISQPSSDLSATISVNDSVNTAIHIVAETVFDQNKIHATEKVFKPMVMSQPFVMYAASGMLRYLKHYGFQTFGDFWDESYDQETNHEKRLQKVSQLIHNLNSLGAVEFEQLMANCQSVVEHNRNHFYSEQFERLLLAELHSNVTNAVFLQKQKMQQDPGGSFLSVLDSLHSRDIKFCDHTVTTLREILAAMKKAQPQRAVRVVTQYPWISDYLR